MIILFVSSRLTASVLRLSWQGALWSRTWKVWNGAVGSDTGGLSGSEDDWD